MSSEQVAKIKEQKLKKIVFVITDGAPNDPNANARAIANLTSSGVLTFGFQIGDIDKDDETTFDYVWNRRQTAPLGVVIGDDLQKLPQLLTNTLANTMKGIRL